MQPGRFARQAPRRSSAIISGVQAPGISPYSSRMISPFGTPVTQALVLLGRVFERGQRDRLAVEHPCVLAVRALAAPPQRDPVAVTHQYARRVAGSVNYHGQIIQTLPNVVYMSYDVR